MPTRLSGRALRAASVAAALAAWPAAAGAANDHQEAVAALADVRAAITELVQTDVSPEADHKVYHAASQRAINLLAGQHGNGYAATTGAPTDATGAIGHVDTLLDHGETPVWAEPLHGAEANLRAAIAYLQDSIGADQLADYQIAASRALNYLVVARGSPTETGMLGGLEGVLANTVLGVPADATQVDACQATSAAPVYGTHDGYLAWVTLSGGDGSHTLAEAPGGTELIVRSGSIVLHTAAAALVAASCDGHVEAAARPPTEAATQTSTEAAQPSANAAPPPADAAAPSTAEAAAQPSAKAAPPPTDAAVPSTTEAAAQPSADAAAPSTNAAAPSTTEAAAQPAADAAAPSTNAAAPSTTEAAAQPSAKAAPPPTDAAARPTDAAAPSATDAAAQPPAPPSTEPGTQPSTEAAAGPAAPQPAAEAPDQPPVGAPPTEVTAQSTVAVPPPLYTKAQAQEGAQLFAGKCGGCHGNDLQGTTAPSIAGKDFLRTAERNGWTLAVVQYQVAHTMRLNPPDSLQPEQYASLMAFLLASNCYPAGSTPYPTAADPVFSYIKLGPLPGDHPGQNERGVCNLD